jgi:hypothetical protein
MILPEKRFTLLRLSVCLEDTMNNPVPALDDGVFRNHKADSACAGFGRKPSRLSSGLLPFQHFA